MSNRKGVRVLRPRPDVDALRRYDDHAGFHNDVVFAFLTT